MTGLSRILIRLRVGRRSSSGCVSRKNLVFLCCLLSLLPGRSLFAQWKTQYYNKSFSDLSSVSFVSPSVGWVVGRPSILMKTTDGGATWTSVKSPSRKSLKIVHFVNSTVGWVMGDYAIYKTIDAGASWTQQEPEWEEKSEDSELEIVNAFFLDANRVWLSGLEVDSSDSSFPIVLMTADGGRTWTRSVGFGAFPAGSVELLKSLFFVNAKVGWAVGLDGVILKSTDGGQNWSLQESTLQWSSGSSPRDSLEAVFFVDAKTGWAVGSKGAMLKTTDGGASWKVRSIGSNRFLTSVFFTNAKTGWVAGGGGTILKTLDGGETWRPQESDTKEAISSIAFVDAQNGWAVGFHQSIVHTSNGGGK